MIYTLINYAKDVFYENIETLDPFLYETCKPNFV